MLRGRIVATLDPATVTPRDLGAYMTGCRAAGRRRRERFPWPAISPGARPRR